MGTEAPKVQAPEDIKVKELDTKLVQKMDPETTFALGKEAEKSLKSLDIKIQGQITGACDGLLKEPNTLTDAQKTALNKVKDFLKPKTEAGTNTTTVTKPKDYFSDIDEKDAGERSKYKADSFILGAKTELGAKVEGGTTDKYINIPPEMKTKLNVALNNPTIKNISAVQTALLNTVDWANIPNDFKTIKNRKGETVTFDKTYFDGASFKGASKTPDGAFGPATQQAFNVYLSQQETTFSTKNLKETQEKNNQRITEVVKKIGDFKDSKSLNDYYKFEVGDDEKTGKISETYIAKNGELVKQEETTRIQTEIADFKKPIADKLKTEISKVPEFKNNGRVNGLVDFITREEGKLTKDQTAFDTANTALLKKTEEIGKLNTQKTEIKNKNDLIDANTTLTPKQKETAKLSNNEAEIILQTTIDKELVEQGKLQNTVNDIKQDINKDLVKLNVTIQKLMAIVEPRKQSYENQMTEDKKKSEDLTAILKDETLLANPKEKKTELENVNKDIENNKISLDALENIVGPKMLAKYPNNTTDYLAKQEPKSYEKVAPVVADKTVVTADKTVVTADKTVVTADKTVVTADKTVVTPDKTVVVAPDRTKNVNKNLEGFLNLPKLSPEELNKNLQENFGKLGYEITDNGPTINIKLPDGKIVSDPRFAMDLSKNNSQLDNIFKITGDVGFLDVKNTQDNNISRPKTIIITKNKPA